MAENEAKRAAEDPIAGLQPLKQRRIITSEQPGELGDLKAVQSPLRLGRLIDVDMYEQIPAATYFTTLPQQDQACKLFTGVILQTRGFLHATGH